MKRGFTLIEMMAVIVLLALIALIAIPLVVNQVRSKKDEISVSSVKIIYSATELYMSDNKETYPMNLNDSYCISLETLVNAGKLKKPFKDVTTGKEVPLNKKVKIMVNEYGEGEYTVVEKNGC